MIDYLFFQFHSIHLQTINVTKRRNEYDFSKCILVAILTTPRSREKRPYVTNRTNIQSIKRFADTASLFFYIPKQDS